jgi:hypothetical protein
MVMRPPPRTEEAPASFIAGEDGVMVVAAIATGYRREAAGDVLLLLLMDCCVRKRELRMELKYQDVRKRMEPRPYFGNHNLRYDWLRWLE